MRTNRPAAHRQPLAIVRQAQEVKDVILPISLFTVQKNHTFTTGSQPGRTLGLKMQSWTLVAEASTIEAFLGPKGIKPNWRDANLTFTITGTRGDVNFCWQATDWNEDSDGPRDIAGWRFAPETATDMHVLDRASVTVLIIND